MTPIRAIRIKLIAFHESGRYGAQAVSLAGDFNRPVRLMGGPMHFRTFSAAWRSSSAAEGIKHHAHEAAGAVVFILTATHSIPKSGFAQLLK